MYLMTESVIQQHIAQEPKCIESVWQSRENVENKENCDFNDYVKLVM